MPKKISIKTVDGNRYECDSKNIESWDDNGWMRVRDGSTIRAFYIKNIVSVTEKEAE